MKIITWMDRVRDGSNLWLEATILEESGKTLEAFALYLKDAASCLKENLIVRGALSCSCAANCLRLMGDLASARKLYAEAAKIYETHAYAIIDKSIRESLWSLQQACEHFNLGGNNQRAQELSEKYISLCRKVDPFFGERDAMHFLRFTKDPFECKSDKSLKDLQISAKISEAVDGFTTFTQKIYNNRKGESSVSGLKVGKECA